MNIEIRSSLAELDKVEVKAMFKGDPFFMKQSVLPLLVSVKGGIVVLFEQLDDLIPWKILGSSIDSYRMPSRMQRGRGNRFGHGRGRGRGGGPNGNYNYARTTLIYNRGGRGRVHRSYSRGDNDRGLTFRSSLSQNEQFHQQKRQARFLQNRGLDSSPPPPHTNVPLNATFRLRTRAGFRGRSRGRGRPSTPNDLIPTHGIMSSSRRARILDMIANDEPTRPLRGGFRGRIRDGFRGRIRDGSRGQMRGGFRGRLRGGFASTPIRGRGRGRYESMRGRRRGGRRGGGVGRGERELIDDERDEEKREKAQEREYLAQARALIRAHREEREQKRQQKFDEEEELDYETLGRQQAQQLLQRNRGRGRGSSSYAFWKRRMNRGRGRMSSYQRRGRGRGMTLRV